jgi:preprotein translocase subunit SecE
MLVLSIVFALAGPFADMIYTKDWWHPLTLTNTTIGPESLLFGFMIGGIASVLYEVIFNIKPKLPKTSKRREKKENVNLVFILLIITVLFFGSFYFLKFNSLISTILALLTPTIIIWIKRKDLIINSLITGLLLVIATSIVYSLLNLFTPGWIQAFWYFKNIPNIVIFNVPLDDIIWYFLIGLLIGPLYEFWKEERY